MLDRQRDILLSLVNDIEGKAWSRDRNGWNDDEDIDVCSWDGIRCDPVDQQTVIGIDLPSSDYAGTLAAEIGRLTTLRFLGMSHNLIRGVIPSEIARLPHLEIVDLRSNLLTGEVPLFSSPLLSNVTLSSNRLGGSLPSDLGMRHERLLELDLSDNLLEGRLPESFAAMKALDSLDLSLNSFSGTIPSSLGSCKALQYLFLNDNFLMGTIPPQIARVGSPVQELWVQRNQLSGTIPAAIAEMENLYSFFIDENKFTGTIPKSICKKQINEDWFGKDVENENRNYCDSVGCPSGSSSPEGVWPCTECADSHVNPYLGRIGLCIDYEQRNILQSLFNATNGPHWKKLAVPWSPDNDYYCSFTGITCDQKKNILKIELKNSGLKGTVPPELGFLQSLQVLDLSDNQLTGFLPSDLRFCPLDKLVIAGNRIGGIVPPMLCIKAGINGNGENGGFGCESIACPIGYYSQSGIGASVGVDEDGASSCLPCPGSNVLAAKTCPFTNTANARRDLSGGKIFGILLGAVIATAMVIHFIRKISKAVRDRRGHSISTEEASALHDFDPVEYPPEEEHLQLQ